MLIIAHLPSGSSPQEGTMFPLYQLLLRLPTHGAARLRERVLPCLGESLLSTKAGNVLGANVEMSEIWRRESDNFSKEKIHNYS